MKQQFNLLIIDDEVNDTRRSSIYEYIFSSEFNLYLQINDVCEIELLINKSFDCIILDNNLNTGDEKNEVLKMLKRFNIPIILVSSEREFNFWDWGNSDILDCISLQPYIQSRNIKEDLSGIEELQRLMLKELHKRIEKVIYDKTKATLNDNKKIILYHFSDIQLTDLHSNFLDVRSFFSKVTTHIQSRNPQPDYIAFTGDIAFAGKKEEYEQIKVEVKSFVDKIFTKDTHRAIFVPGNHDVDYNTFLLDSGEENSKLNERGVQTINEMSFAEGKFDRNLNPSHFDKFHTNNSSLNNFQCFSYFITRNEKYLANPIFISDKSCMKKGLEVVAINNAYAFSDIGDGQEKMYHINYNDYIDEISTLSNTYKILLGHIDPESLGYKKYCTNQDFSQNCNPNYAIECVKSTCCAKWGDMERILNDTNSIIYLYGHAHFSQYKISEDKKFLFIGAGSPNGVNHVEKTFNVIETEDEERCIKLKMIIYSMENKGVKIKTTTSFEYDKENHEWSKL